MNMHRFTSVARSGMRRLALSLLGGLVVLSMLVSPVAFAAVARPASPALSSTGILDLAGVSVLRLSISYTTAQNRQITCTALGALIASWPAASTTDQNNWGVTDSSVLSPTGGKCAPGSSLTSIQILANNLYTSNTSSLSLLDTLHCSKAGICEDQQGTAGPVGEALSRTPVGGGVLFSFHTSGLDMQPFLDTGQANPLTGTGIELATQGQSPTWPQTQASQLPQESFTQALSFLTPVIASSGTLSRNSTATPTSSPSAPGAAAPTKFEPGMPFVDALGHFIGMQVLGSTAAFTVTDLLQLENAQPAFQPQVLQRKPHAPNLLKQQWDAGIVEFDLGTPAGYRQAQQEWSVILDHTRVDNPNFQAARTFSQEATAKLSPSGSGSTTTGGSNGSHGNAGLSGLNRALVITGLAAAIILLILLLVLVSILAGRRHARRRRDKQELDRFKEEAAAARRQAPVEAQRIAGESQRRQAQPKEAGSPQSYPPHPQTAPLPPVASQAPVIPPAAQQPQQTQQEQWQPPPEYAAYAAADMPTVDSFEVPTEPATRKNGHVVREWHNVSLAVGSLSNVGLKRQHKPNEDSLFAMQGARTFNSQPQQFGLFVIADGMGGHANGGDASRTAIQTMIDYMLPRISIADPSMDDQSYLKLLEEGVQHANYAVHQRNIQDRADMGTTMTTALVIGAMAYVANVGDSRTYLYRPSTGLTKITRDHSVVASLVDAGIIKPDDIYTHPKRNQIYRSLGEKPVVEVDSFTVELQAGDKLLLCSDGLWDMVRDPDIQHIIAEADASPAQTSEELVQAALAGGGEDNVSVIVVSVTEIDGHTGMTGIHILSKPENVTVPDLPAI
jgi:serine/threonine protein phosphatase PrpC